MDAWLAYRILCAGLAPVNDLGIRVFAKILFSKFTCLPLKKVNCLPTNFWCVCAINRGKQNPGGDAFETEKGNGDVRDYNIRTAAVVLYDTSTRCTYSSLEPVSYTHLTLPTILLV